MIRGYHAEADLSALGREVQALIAIRIRPPSRENIEAFRDWAHELPETFGVFVVSGGDDVRPHSRSNAARGLTGVSPMAPCTGEDRSRERPSPFRGCGLVAVAARRRVAAAAALGGALLDLGSGG